MRLWYWLRKDLKEDQSRAEWLRFQRYSALRTENLKARRVEVNQEPAVKISVIYVSYCMFSCLPKTVP